MTGRVHRYNGRFGFIRIYAGDWFRDYFFQGGDVVGTEPATGSMVTFLLDDDPRKDALRAVEVTVFAESGVSLSQTPRT